LLTIRRNRSSISRGEALLLSRLGSHNPRPPKLLDPPAPQAAVKTSDNARPARRAVGAVATDVAPPLRRHCLGTRRRAS